MKFVNKAKNEIVNKLKDKNVKYFVETMGCKLNENDSLKYQGIMESMNIYEASTIEDAKIILFNTCCIRENAEEKLFGRLGALKKRKQQEKDLIIVVLGCMTQQKHIIEKINKSYPFVDIVLGTNSMATFPDKLLKVINSKEKVREYIEDTSEVLEEVPIKYEEGNKASVSIIYGCNNFCSYCIVPYVRGREKSRKKEDIIKDIKKCIEKGYKEITLLGQNVNSYGNDLNDPESTFANLLREINKVDGVEIIRFMSPHPKDFKDDVIAAIRDCDKVTKQIHLPLQAGSTKVLKSMNRRYTKEQYLELVEKIKKEIPDVSFTTDIITGFPGETEEDFEDTLDVVRKVVFDQIFMFVYSIRKGTAAEKMENQVEEHVKVERLERLKKLNIEQIEQINKTMIGKTYKILVEGKSKNNDKLYTGRTDNNKVVVFEANEEDIGKILNIKIKSEHLWYLKGEKV